ncbi:MAG: tRNA (adenosine(37)-N6)-threonylcarbamoyltransferase complex dimerization subunit type 1 TsaB [Phycisphaerae bacterium]
MKGDATITRPPRIVAIETSSRIGEVAVARGREVLGRRQFSKAMRHAVELMPAIRDLTQAQGWKPSDIDAVYVSAGPGSFTGIRIAITIARALQQAIGCQLVSVPTVDVLAANAPSEVEHLAVIMDAKRGQIYAARYQRVVESGELRRTLGPVLTDPADFLAQAPRALHIMGEGIDYHRPVIAAAAGVIIELDKSLWQPQAVMVHRIGLTLANAGVFTQRDALLPIYLRKAEAEEVWEKKHAITSG